MMSEEELRKLLTRHAREAINVQDAVNLSGVVYAFARSMQLLCEISNRFKHSTDWKNKHPIAVLFASKINALTHADSMAQFSLAYASCNVLALGTADRWE